MSGHVDFGPAYRDGLLRAAAICEERIKWSLRGNMGFEADAERKGMHRCIAAIEREANAAGAGQPPHETGFKSSGEAMPAPAVCPTTDLENARSITGIFIDVVERLQAEQALRCDYQPLIDEAKRLRALMKETT